MENKVTKEALAEELNKLQADGVNIEYVKYQDKGTCPVRISDPNVNDRVMVTMSIMPCDTEETIVDKMIEAREYLKKAKSLNDYKEVCENFEIEKQKIVDETDATLAKMAQELLKKSPFPFDHLQANSKDFSFKKYSDIVSPFAELKAFPVSGKHFMEEEEEDIKPKKKPYKG